MDPQVATFFYAAAVLCFIIAAVHPQASPGRLWVQPLRWMAAGLTLALVPVLWNTAVAGW